MPRLLPRALTALSLAAVAGLAHAQGPRGNQDANGDGVVSAQEFDAEELAAIQKRMEARRAERPDAGRGGGGSAALSAMDADRDGKITEAEALGAAKARFAALDADKNGELNQAELPARRGPPN